MEIVENGSLIARGWAFLDFDASENDCGAGIDPRIRPGCRGERFREHW